MTNLMFSCDVSPHDEENCSTNEAELNGAGEEEGAAALMQVMHHLESNIKQVSQN